jgi:hypothetical protein
VVIGGAEVGNHMPLPIPLVYINQSLGRNQMVTRYHVREANTPVLQCQFPVVRSCLECGCSEVILCLFQFLINSSVFFNILHFQYSHNLIFLFNDI